MIKKNIKSCKRERPSNNKGRPLRIKQDFFTKTFKTTSNPGQ